MRRKILRGLEVEDFIHPRESTAKKFANASSAVRKFLNSASSLCATAVDPVTQGTFVKINDPKLIKITSDVCRILDVSPVPEIYLCHLMSRDIMPLGSDAPYLVVPDYTLRYSDDDMLYYNFGNAVAMIKADHVELEMLAAYMPGGMLVNAARIIFTQYLHCADATSDRGGLLACQSFAAAVRNHFWELGIPPAESKKFFTTDEEAETFVEEYLVEQGKILNRYNGIVIGIARWWQRMSSIEAPANMMLSELFNWYVDSKGYHALLAKRGNGYV